MNGYSKFYDIEPADKTCTCGACVVSRASKRPTLDTVHNDITIQLTLDASEMRTLGEPEWADNCKQAAADIIELRKEVCRLQGRLL